MKTVNDKAAQQRALFEANADLAGLPESQRLYIVGLVERFVSTINDEEMFERAALCGMPLSVVPDALAFAATMFRTMREGWQIKIPAGLPLARLP